MKLIECPRDAMQGIQPFIPTQQKADYLNQLLAVGFDTIDFGSFVSPKAIPQLQDTAEVLSRIHTKDRHSKLLAIIANQRGANDAVQHEAIDQLGYPFSISETFQQRNTNRSIATAFEDVKQIKETADRYDKELVIYISMGFGNPFGDPWNADFVKYWVDQLAALGVRVFSLADTVGTARADDIRYIFSHLIPAYPELEFGAHFHARPEQWREKVEAAYHSGCQRFDSAAQGFGGCPMAEDELVGNIATENLIAYFSEHETLNLDMQAWQRALAMVNPVFNP
jgi:hydroxymethylglutaryl-CoA lyase